MEGFGELTNSGRKGMGREGLGREDIGRGLGPSAPFAFFGPSQTTI
jgi:hypothetical protein